MKNKKLLKNKKTVKYKKTLIFMIIILIVLIFLGIYKNKILKIIYPEKYNEIINIYAEKYKVDNNLILALIKAESNFDKNVKSNKGAIGLMQLMEETAKEIALKLDLNIKQENIKEELKNPDININIGTKYLSILLEKYKNIEIALTAYNAGIGNVDTWIEKGIIKADGSNIENIPYKETNNYVRSILRDYQIYKDIY